MELFNYKDNCRLCLKTHTDFMKNIFTHCVEGCQLPIVENIFSLFRIELNLHQDYPQLICRKCLTELENILLFKEDLERNQDFLLNLFKTAYPSYVEKKTSVLRNIHTSNRSNDCSIEIKSVAVNTDSDLTELEILDNSEFVQVPVTFIKQFCPQVILQRTEERTLVKKAYKSNEEIIPDDLLAVNKKLPVNVCKYCNKQFRSEILVQTHYKNVHGLDGPQKRNVNRKRVTNTVKKPLVKKIKTDEIRNISHSNLSDLLLEQPDLPQIDLQNHFKAGSEEKIVFTPIIQQISDVKPTELVLQENQASFLQNFNLIAKQKAALIRTQQETLSRRIPKRNSFKKQIVSRNIKKIVCEPLKSKNIKNKVVKPLSARPKKSISKNDYGNVLCRSLQFLKRYGWRELNSNSRRGTTINSDRKFNLRRRHKVIKTFPKQVHITKNGTKNIVLNDKPILKCDANQCKIVFKEESCERAPNVGNSVQVQNSTRSDVYVKSSKLVDIFDSKNLTTIPTCSPQKNTSTTTSKDSKILIENRNIKDSPTAKCSKLKSEIPPNSLKGENDEFHDYEAISSKSFYVKRESDVSKEYHHVNNLIPDKSNSTISNKKKHFRTKLNDSESNSYINKRLKLEPWNSFEPVKGSRSGSITSEKQVFGNHIIHKNSLRSHEPQCELNETDLQRTRAGNTQVLTDFKTKSKQKVWSCRSPLKKSDVFNDANRQDVNNKFQVELERKRANKTHHGFNRASTDSRSKIYNSNESAKKHEIFNLDNLVKGDITKLSKKVGRPKKNADASTSSYKSNSSSVKEENPNDISSPSGVNCNVAKKVEQYSGTYKSSLPNTKRRAKLGKDLNKEVHTDEIRNTIFNKRGRPKKDIKLEHNSLLSRGTDTSLSDFANLDVKISPNFSVQSVVNNKSSLLEDAIRNECSYMPISDTSRIKNEELSTLQDLNDRYEIDENIGLRIKLRRTVSCDSFNILKYDTQEIDERLQPKREIVDAYSYINYNGKVESEKSLKSDSMSNVSLKAEGSTHDKVVNIDLEDEEVQMLVLLSDDECVSFDDDDISKYVKSRKNSLDSKLYNCINKSKNNSYSLNGDVTSKNSIIIQSSTVMETPLKKFDNGSTSKLLERSASVKEEDVSGHLIGNEFQAKFSTNLKDKNLIPAKRRGRSPTKFPYSFDTIRSKSVTDSEKSLDGFIDSIREKCPRIRSRSSSQTGVNISEVVKKVGKRGRPSKMNKIKDISTLTRSKSMPKTSNTKSGQNKIIGRQEVSNSVRAKKFSLDPSDKNNDLVFYKKRSLREKKKLNNKYFQADHIKTCKDKEKQKSCKKI